MTTFDDARFDTEIAHLLYDEIPAQAPHEPTGAECEWRNRARDVARLEAEITAQAARDFARAADEAIALTKPEPMTPVEPEDEPDSTGRAWLVVVGLCAAGWAVVALFIWAIFTKPEVAMFLTGVVWSVWAVIAVRRHQRGKKEER